MRVQIVMKMPDAFDQVKDAIQSATKFTETDELESDDEAKAKSVFDRFFKYGETATLELDTEKRTCIVLPV